MRIELERVELREPGINIPGEKVGLYPTRERILQSTSNPNKRLTREHHFVLWHDGEFVYVAHPERPTEPEIVPMANVVQMRASLVQEKKVK